LARVLVVDDEMNVRRLLAVTLKSLGYEVIEAVSGEDALAKFTANDGISLVISDIKMAEIDGLRLTQILREQQVTIPILLISAAVQDEQAALHSGANQFLAKPFSRDRMIETLNGLSR
jgi:CheY-like chemotaxis protein